MARPQRLTIAMLTSRYDTELPPLGESDESDAANFFGAAGITDGTQRSAVNTLVRALKTAGLWSDLVAFYPFVGGSAGAHKYNLVDPRDLDAAFRITWSGSVTHNANGITGNGTDAYGDTHFVDSNAWGVDNGAAFMYSRTSPATAGYAFASSDGSFGKQFLLSAKYSDNNAYCLIGSNTYDPHAVVADGLGLWTVSRQQTIPVVTKGYKRAIEVISQAEVSPTFNGVSVFLLANNLNGTASTFWPGNLACAGFFMNGKSAANVSDLYAAVQAFQTTLGRQV